MSIKSLKPLYVSLLLFTATIAVYYASILDVFFRQNVMIVEDYALLMSIANNKLNLGSFINFASSGKYARPFTYLSFYIDYTLWGDGPFGYRLTNLLIHAANVVLCYLMSIHLLKDSERKLEISFFAALLFAFHPTAVESVSWISGRTDPVATLSSLSAIILYFRAKKTGNWYLIPLSFLLMIISALSKEIGLATPLVIGAFELFYGRSFGYKRWKYSFPAFSCFLLAVPVYLIIRSMLLGKKDFGLGLIAGDLLGKDLSLTLVPFLASFGFYLKKFLYPYPLNFTITEINLPLYSTLGVAALLVFTFSTLSERSRKYHFFVFWAFLAVGPAALISFTDIAWTPWAERYLYFSLVPLSIAAVSVVFSLSKIKGENSKEVVSLLLATLCGCFFFSTLDRSNLMNDDLELLEDSYRKSPGFISIAVVYANSLAQNKRLEEAEAILLDSEKLPGAKHTLYYSLGYIHKINADYEKAESYLYEALREAREDKRLVTMGRTFRKDIFLTFSELEMLKARKTGSMEEGREHFFKAADFLIAAYGELPDSFLLYRTAKLYLSMGENELAAEYFRKFIERRGDDFYREAAEKLLKKIEEKSLPSWENKES